MAGGDNEYVGRVFADDGEDAEATPLLRALHAATCRVGVPHAAAFPACVRAAMVVRRWEADGRPSGT